MPFYYRLRELEEGIGDEDTITRRSAIVYASPQSDLSRSVPVQVSTEPVIHSPPPSTVPSPPPQEISQPAAVLPPPPITLSPILGPVSPVKPDTSNLEAKLKLESRIIELQGRHQNEAKARRQLERELAVMEDSKMVDMETVCELEQRVHDLEQSNQLYKEKVSQLLATPPLVCRENTLNSYIATINNSLTCRLKQ